LIAHYEDVGLNPPVPIHLPAPSYFPIVMAAGLPIVFYGVIYHNSVVGKLAIALGALISLSALIGWGMEPLEEATEGPHEEAYEEPQEMVEEPGGEVEE
jgi:hypothetical protein